MKAALRYGEKQTIPSISERPNSCARGYDRRWRSFRAAFLKRHPYCEDCLAAQLVRPSREVHHIAKVADAPERRLDETNCRALCKRCHSQRTARGE